MGQGFILIGTKYRSKKCRCDVRIRPGVRFCPGSCISVWNNNFIKIFLKIPLNSLLLRIILHEFYMCMIEIEVIISMFFKFFERKTTIEPDYCFLLFFLYCYIKNLFNSIKLTHGKCLKCFHNLIMWEKVSKLLKKAEMKLPGHYLTPRLILTSHRVRRVRQNLFCGLCSSN